MSSYEYTVIPAPARGERAKGARSGIERFAATLSEVLNDMARDGWDYVRAETLPAEERSGLTSRTTVYHNILVFRRPVAASRPTLAEPAISSPTPLAQQAPVTPAPAQPAAPRPSAAPPQPQSRGPFSQPMRAAPTAGPSRPRAAEPPLSSQPQPAPSGPRLGPASR